MVENFRLTAEGISRQLFPLVVEANHDVGERFSQFMPGRDFDQRGRFRVFGLAFGFLRLGWVGEPDEFETAGFQQPGLGERCAKLFVGQVASLPVRQRQGERAFLFCELAGDAVGDNTKIV